MALIRRLIERRALSEQAWMQGTALWTRETATGRAVSPSESLQSVAVFACVRVLAETIGTLPLHVYRRLEPRGRERDPRHPLYRALHELPNPEMTSVELREAIVGHLALRGNAYLNVVPLGSGAVELWPLRPDRMRVERLAGGGVGYFYTVGGVEERLARRAVMHLRGLSSDGVVGYAPVTLAREAIGLALAAEEYGARLFANNARPGGALQVKDKLSKEGADRLKASWEAAHGGLDKAHRVAVLEEGVTWQQIGMAPEDAQFLETRKYQTSEIARLFRVPPHLIGDLERATFTNIEHQSLEFVIHTIRPWLVRIEQAIKRDLLTEDTHYAEFLVDGLLRGDVQSRYQAYATGRQNGWLSANDVRDLENMNPLPVDVGDVYWAPLNMVPADKLGEEPAAPAADPPDDDGGDDQAGARAYRAGNRGGAASRLKVGERYRRLLEDAAGRIVRREVANVREAVGRFLGKRDAGQFLRWAEGYSRELGVYADRTMLPVLLAYAEAIDEDAAAEIGADAGLGADGERFVRTYSEAFGRNYAERSLGQLRELVDGAVAAGEDPADVVEGRLAEWGEKRAGKVGRTEATRLAGAQTRATWKRGGVRRVAWAAFGRNCAFCTKLDGKTVSIEESFVASGDDVEGDASTGSFKARHDYRHPPIHQSCNCGLRPG